MSTPKKLPIKTANIVNARFVFSVDKISLDASKAFLPENIAHTREFHKRWVRWILSCRYRTPLERLEDFEQEVWYRALYWEQGTNWRGSIRTLLKLICRGVVRDYIVHSERSGRLQEEQMPLLPNGQIASPDMYQSSKPPQEAMAIICDLVHKLPARYKRTLGAYLNMEEYWRQWHLTGMETMPYEGQTYANAKRIREINERRHKGMWTDAT